MNDSKNKCPVYPSQQCDISEIREIIEDEGVKCSHKGNCVGRVVPEIKELISRGIGLDDFRPRRKIDVGCVGKLRISIQYSL